MTKKDLIERCRKILYKKQIEEQDKVFYEKYF
jgi:hypothetical protein